MTQTSTQYRATTYSFDAFLDRTGSESTKWHRYDDDVLPMWVADMDFSSPPSVIRALRERVEHGAFGYEQAPEDLPDLIADRLDRVYGWQVSPEAIVFTPGVVVGFNLGLQAFVKPSEAVLIQTPVYGPILHAAKVCGVQGQSMALTPDHDGRYTVDLDRFAAKVTDRTRLFLLCNPHNPVGRVFTYQELAAMGDICVRNDLVICSDEIHGDLVFEGHPHIPIAAMSPELEARTITLMAPSKTFNVPGLHLSFAVIPNGDLRRQYNAARRGLVGSPNLMGYTAARAAYAEGEPWLAALLAYLEANRDIAVATIRQQMPELRTTNPEGTYLLWIDCRDAGLPDPPQTYFLERGRVAFNDGATFGPSGKGFVRLNFGCPRSLLDEGLSRMRAALDAR